MTDIAISIGLDSSPAKVGRDEILSFGNDIVAMYARITQAQKEQASQTAGAGLQGLREQKTAAEDVARTYDRAAAEIMAGDARRLASTKALADAGDRAAAAIMLAEQRKAEAAQKSAAQTEAARVKSEAAQAAANDRATASIMAGELRRAEAAERAAQRIAAAQSAQNAQYMRTDAAAQSFSGYMPSGASARDSASVFQAQFAAEEQALLAREKAANAVMSADMRRAEVAQKAANDDIAASDRAAASLMASELRREQAAQKAAVEQERSVARLTGTYAPYAAELHRLAKDEATINSLRASGALDSKTAEMALAALHSRQAVTTAEMHRMANGAKLSSYELRNLSYQLNDVVSGLAMGQSPMMILTQQGGQFVQIFQAAGISVGGVAVGIGSLVAILGTATAAVISHSNSMREVASAYALQGGYVGKSRSQLEALARQAEQTGGISVREARALEAATLSAGQVSGGALKQIASSARMVADALTDGDLTAAGKMLTQAFLDPEKAAKQLDTQLNFLTDSQRRQISTLAARNDKDAAFKIIMDAINPRLKDHAANINPITQAWREATDAISGYYDALGRGLGGGQTTQQQIEDAERRIAGIKASYGGGPMASADASRVAELQATIARLRSQFQSENATAAFDGDMAKWREQDKIGGQIGRDLTPGLAAIDALKAKKAELEASIKAGPNIGTSAESILRQKTALDAVNVALATYKTEGEKAVLVAEAQAAAAKMGEAEGARYLARRQAEISLMGQAIPQSERENTIRAATVQIMAQWASSTNTTIRNLQNETAAQQELNTAIGRGYEARKRAEIANAVAAARRANPSMSSGVEADLRRDLARKEEARRAGEEFTDLQSLQDSAKYENMRADAIMRGAEAMRLANVEIETQKRLEKYGGSKDDIRKAVNDDSLAQQRSELASKASGLSATLQSKQEMQDLDLVIAKMRELGATSEEIAQVYQNAEIRKLEASQDWADGAQASLMRYTQNASNYGASAGNAVSSGMRSMENALVSFSSKTMTAAQAFKSMASSIIQDLIRMQVQARITGPLSKALSGGIDNMFSSPGKDTWTPSYGSSLPDVPAYAGGTDYASGGLSLVGENGPELMQLPGGSRIYPADETSAILSPKAANANERTGGNVVQITNYVEAGASMADVEAAVASGISQAAPHLISAAVQQSVPASLSAVQSAANRGGSFAQAVGRR